MKRNGGMLWITPMFVWNVRVNHVDQSCREKHTLPTLGMNAPVQHHFRSMHHHRMLDVPLPIPLDE